MGMFFDLMAKNRSRYVVYADRFQAVFGTPLHIYWDVVLSFDIVQFDTHVVKSGRHESITDAVMRQWGIEGVNILRGLVGLPEEEER